MFELACVRSQCVATIYTANAARKRIFKNKM